MKKILLLTDCSAVSRNALQFARSFFGGTVADFHLLCPHPAEPGDGYDSGAVAEVSRSTRADQLHAIVTGLRREAANDWHTFRSSDRPGHPLRVVEQALKAEVYDFVVIGPQPDDDDTDALFGNSVIALVHQLKANVLVVPGNALVRPIRQVVLAADFANLKDCKRLSPVKEFVLFKGAGLTLLTIDTPDKKAIDIERETQIRQFLLPIEPTIARLKAPNAKQGIDAYLNKHPVDFLVTIPTYNPGTHPLMSSRFTHSGAFTPPVPLLTLYDDGSNDRPRLVDDLSNADYAF